MRGGTRRKGGGRGGWVGGRREGNMEHVGKEKGEGNMWEGRGEHEGNMWEGKRGTWYMWGGRRRDV